MHSAGPIVKDSERRIERICGQETALVECAGCTRAPQSQPRVPRLGGWPESSHVPIGELTNSDAGSVVVWDHEKAAALFDALAADQPVPSTVIGGQP